MIVGTYMIVVLQRRGRRGVERFREVVKNRGGGRVNEKDEGDGGK